MRGNKTAPEAAFVFTASPAPLATRLVDFSFFSLAPQKRCNLMTPRLSVRNIITAITNILPKGWHFEDQTREIGLDL